MEGWKVYNTHIICNSICIRTAAAIRTAAMTGAQALLQKSQSSQELYDIMPQFLPQVSF